MLKHRRIRVLCFLASVMLHAGVVGLLALLGARGDEAADVASVELDLLDEDRVKLGIERSRAVTMTWIGFETPTEHEAPLSAIDQAQLERASASGATEAPDTPAPGQDGAPAEASAPRPVGDWSNLAPQIDIALDATRLRDLLQQMFEQAALAAEANASTVADAGGEQTTQGESGPQTDTSNKNSDREADAASRRRPVNVTPGQPVAAEGLEIKTSRPRFTQLMRATLRPRNPKIDITFGPDGKAKFVRFVTEDGRVQTSGSSDVDDVLINAMYRWTASGVAIDELDPADPDAGVTITLRIILR